MAMSSVLGHHQSHKLEQCKTIEEKDRISDLPDEILSNILAKLTLKEAIATSILSNRWTDLRVSHPVLDFGFFENINYTEVLVHRVNKIVEKFDGGKLHKFRIVHSMSERFKSHIDEWISFATRNRVSDLELDFRDWAKTDGFENYCVLLHVFAREEMMVSNRSSLNVVRSFVSLKDLRLKSVDFSDQVFDIILYNCSSLETLHLIGNRGLVVAKNTAPHLKLKSLKLYNCLNLKQLELLAPNLVSFEYSGPQRYLCIKDAQQLVSLSLSAYIPPEDFHEIFPRGKKFIFNQFSSYLPNLESLFVSVNIFGNMSNFAKLRVFSNLKTLVLEAPYLDTIRLCCQVAAFIISAAPCLKLLELHLTSRSTPFVRLGVLELPPLFTHTNLKEVKVSGFRANLHAMDFLAYLVRCSVSLQKIDLTAEQGLWSDAASCKKCVQKLKKSLSSNVQLIFHDQD